MAHARAGQHPTAIQSTATSAPRRDVQRAARREPSTCRTDDGAVRAVGVERDARGVGPALVERLDHGHEQLAEPRLEIGVTEQESDDAAHDG